MSISRIVNQAYVNSYNTNKVMQIDKSKEVKSTDRIEISSFSKKLREVEEIKDLDNSAKVEALKYSIDNNTYNVEAKLTARSILNAMQGEDI